MDFRFDPTSDAREGRFRLRAPREFEPGSFRRAPAWAGKAAPGVSFVVGTVRGTGGEAAQAIRFDRALWTEDEAGRWAADAAFAATWGAADWEKVTRAARVFAEADVRFADDGYDDGEEVETAFTPTNVLNWLDKTADDRVDAVVGGYLKKFRKTALGQFAKGATVADLRRSMQAQDPDLPEKVARREARTMTTAVYNYSKMERYSRDKAVSGFLFVAILDEVTSDICRALAGKRFAKDEVADYLPPLHYNCRSTIRAITVFDAKDEVEKYPTVDDARAADPDAFAADVDANLDDDFRTPEGFVKFTEASWKNPREIKLKPTNAKLLGTALNAISDDLIERAGDVTASEDVANTLRERVALWKDRAKGIAKAGNMHDSFEELLAIAKGVRRASDIMLLPGSAEAVALGDYVENLAATWETFYTGGKTKRPKKAKAESIETPVGTVEATAAPVALAPPPTMSRHLPRAKRYQLASNILEAFAAPIIASPTQGADLFSAQGPSALVTKLVFRQVAGASHKVVRSLLSADMPLSEMRRKLGEPDAVWSAMKTVEPGLARWTPDVETKIRAILDPVVQRFGAELDAAATAPRDVNNLRRGSDIRAEFAEIPKREQAKIDEIDKRAQALYDADTARGTAYEAERQPHKIARWAIDDEIAAIQNEIGRRAVDAIGRGEVADMTGTPEETKRLTDLNRRRDELLALEQEINDRRTVEREQFLKDLDAINAERKTVLASRRKAAEEALAIEDPARQTTIKMQLPAKNRALDPARYVEAAAFLSRITGLRPGETMDVGVTMTSQDRAFHYGLEGAATDFSRRGNGYLRGTAGKINLSAQEPAAVIAHETGHFLEDRFEGVTLAIREFYDRRTKGEIPKHLGRGYGKSERTRKDKFISAYTGKEYGVDSRGSEVLSMGIQHLFEDPVDFAQKDPDHFDFIVDLLRGHDV